MRQGLLLTVVVSPMSRRSAAQSSTSANGRALRQDRLGGNTCATEAWPSAANLSSTRSTSIPSSRMRYYGLGRAQHGDEEVAEAIAAYVKCRDLYRAQAGKKFTNSQEAQRYRQDRLTEIDEQIRMTQTGPQSLTSQDRVRQLQDQRRQIQDYISRAATSASKTLSPRSSRWLWGAPTSGPNSSSMPNASTKRPSPRIRRRVRPIATSQWCTCRPDATRRPRMR